MTTNEMTIPNEYSAFLFFCVSFYGQLVRLAGRLTEDHTSDNGHATYFVSIEIVNTLHSHFQVKTISEQQISFQLI